MLRNILHRFGTLLLAGMLFHNICYGQAPVISYPSPKTYIINIPISPLSSANTGGAVAPNVYGSVTLFAGQTGVQGSSGGGLGQSQFIMPYTICTNQVGNIFVNDPINKAIKEISPQGNVTFRSQGVPANAPQDPNNQNNFENPVGIAADAADNVYIADSGNNLIRKVASNQIISIFAGNRLPVSSDGTGVAAGFNQPTEMTIDSVGNLYVVDGGYSNNKIRKITPAGVVTTLFTLTNVGKIGGIVRDKNGNFFVTKPTEHTIDKITATGVETVFAGTGVAGSTDGSLTTATFNTPGGIAIDGEQNLYVVSTTDNLVRKVTAAGIVSTFAGQQKAGHADGIGTNASFNMPVGIAFDSNGNGYISDSENFTVRKMATSGYEINKALPPGLTFDNTTGIITGTPTALFPATDYTITAHNFYGSNTTVVRIQVVVNGNLSFPAIADKTTCSADFDPGATSQNIITYTSSNTSVATITSGNKIHIVSSGMVSITANDGMSTLTKTFNVTYAAQPTIIISASANPVCVGTQVTYTAITTNAGTNPAFMWQVNGMATTFTGAIYTALLNNNDVITCVLVADNTCNTPITSNSITQQVDATPTITFNPPSVSVVPGGSIQLNPIITGNVVGYSWVPFSGLNDATVANPIASITSPATYKLTVTTPGGCTASNTVSVNLITRIIVHNTFTPNGDGINDTWNIPDLAYFPNCTVKIYNRYGSLIFNTISYAKPWDGTFNGLNLPTGSYYYIIDPKNQTPLISGEVMLIR